MSMKLALLCGAIALLGASAFAQSDVNPDELESRVGTIDSARDTLELRSSQLDSQIGTLEPQGERGAIRDSLELQRDELESRRNGLESRRDELESRRDELQR